MNRDKYPNWDQLTDAQKLTAIRRELELVTHNGTTKDDLMKMLRYLMGKQEGE